MANHDQNFDDMLLLKAAKPMPRLFALGIAGVLIAALGVITWGILEREDGGKKAKKQPAAATVGPAGK